MGRFTVLHRFIMGAALLAFTPIAESQPQESKRPWEWTTGERLAARFQEEAVMRRWNDARSRAAQRPTTPQAAKRPAGQILAIVDGSRDPELFLPSELYLRMVRLAFASRGDGAGERYQLLLQKRSYGVLDTQEEWENIWGWSRELVENLQAEENLAASRDPNRTEQVRTLIEQRCGLLRAALRKARDHYGSSEFDRFLYTAVAPDLMVSWPWSAESAKLHRQRLERLSSCE